MPMSEIDDSELVSIENTKANAPRSFWKDFATTGGSIGSLVSSGAAGVLRPIETFGRFGQNVGQGIRNLTGETEPGWQERVSGGLADAAQQGRETAQKYWQGQSDIDPESFAGKVYQGAGGLPAAVMEWNPAMAAMGATNKAVEGDYGGAASDIAARAGLGMVFGGLGNIPGNIPGTAAKQALGAAATGATTALQGGDTADIGSSALFGGIMPIGTKRTAPEELLSTIATKYRNAIGISKKATPGGATQLKADINAGITAVTDITNTYAMRGAPPPKTKLEHLEALGERKKAYRDIYAPMQEAASQAGAVVDLRPIAAELRRQAKDPITLTERPQDSKWLMEKADAIEHQQQYTPMQADEVVKKNNDLIYATDDVYDIPSVGSIANLKLYTDLLRGNLINTMESAGFEGYKNARDSYGTMAEAEFAADKRVRKEINRIDPNFFSSYQGALTGLEALKLIAGGGHIASPGAAYGFKELMRQLSSPDKDVNTMYKAADKYVRATIPKELIGPRRELSQMGAAAAQGIDTTDEDNEMSYIEGL